MVWHVHIEGSHMNNVKCTVFLVLSPGPSSSRLAIHDLSQLPGGGGLDGAGFRAWLPATQSPCGITAGCFSWISTDVAYGVEYYCIDLPLLFPLTDRARCTRARLEEVYKALRGIDKK